MPNSVDTRPNEDINNTLIRVKSPAWAPVLVDWLAFGKAVNKINKLKEESNANSCD